jgi:hypothetical protein
MQWFDNKFLGGVSDAVSQSYSAKQLGIEAKSKKVSSI